MMETRRVWVERIAKQKASKLTDKQFAEEIGASVQSVAAWRRRFQQEEKAQEAKAVTFVEITSNKDAAAIEVVLPSKARVLIRPGFDVPTLKRLMEVLVAL
jgi:hypothetical protein